MEIILREHVENLGRRGDVVKVADGYARNFLLPRKLAMLANPANKKIVERQGKIAEVKELAARSVAEAYAVRLSHADIVIARRVGENETLYGSVSSADIADDLKAKGFEVDKRKISLDEPLKQLGEFTVPIKLHADVVAQLRVKVTALAEAKE
jgi:large subunit ribosomal protein L9